MGEDEIIKRREVLYALHKLLLRTLIFESLGDKSDKLNFLREYKRCLIESIAIDWCKVFGNDAHDTHWKNIISKEEHSQFKTCLDKMLTENDFETLAKIGASTKRYRDTAVAHLDLNDGKRAKTYPKIAPLRATAEILYERIFKELKALGREDGFIDPVGMTGKHRKDSVEHYRGIVNTCRTALKGWTNKKRP